MHISSILANEGEAFQAVSDIGNDNALGSNEAASVLSVISDDNGTVYVCVSACVRDPLSKNPTSLHFLKLFYNFF